MIYLDQAATSFPKAPGVGNAVKAYIDDCGMNVNRGAYQAASRAEAMVMDTRELLSGLFHHDDPSRVVFTSGQTASLNMILFGFLGPGDSCLISGMEHNAVMRPLQALKQRGVKVVTVPCRMDGSMDINTFQDFAEEGVRLAVVTHASNVCGTMLPLKEIASVCKGKGIPLVVDAAQTAGHVPIDFTSLGLSGLCVPGHKGLLGPQGIGAALLSEKLALKLRPLIYGGTGSASHEIVQPDFLPDKFEAGTMNLPGIAGMNRALSFISKNGVAALGRRESSLTLRFLEGLSSIDGVVALGLKNADGRVGVVSIDFPGKDNAEAAYLLDSLYGVQTRCGLHCAPCAHRTLGSYPQGTVRFSFGYGNTPRQIDLALEAVSAVSKG